MHKKPYIDNFRRLTLDLLLFGVGGGLAPFGNLGFGVRFPKPKLGSGVLKSRKFVERFFCDGVCIFALRTISCSADMPILSLANVKSRMSREPLDGK